VTYTSHGHHIPGTQRADEAGQIEKARCGGLALCSVCQRDVTQHFLPDLPEVEEAAKFFEDISEYDQDPDRFMKQAKLFVIGARNNTVDNEDQELSVDDLYIVWLSKTLANWKAMISTRIPGDGLYFEVTHNGEKNETYVDTYIKISNDKFSQEGEN
jgi:hypothetical protein